MDIDTNPEGSVADGSPSIEDRMLSLMGTEDGQPERRDEEAEAEEPEGQPEAEAQEESEELPEDSEESEEAEEVEAEAEEAEEQDDDQPKRTFKIGDAEVTEDELINGYQRQADYTRKTQEIAEQRRAFEAKQAEIAQERQRYAQSLEYLQSQIPMPQQPDSSLLESDPVEYLRQKEAFDSAMQRQHAIAMERQRVEQQTTAERQQARQELVRAEAERMAELIPEWSEPEKRQALVSDLTSYMKAEGFPEEEIGNITYARHLNVVRKAMAYDKLMSQKPKVEKKVREAPKVVKPGSGTNRSAKDDAEVRARGRLKKTGSLDDAASLILSRMK